MKKIFTLAILSLSLMSCSTEDEQDCNCDRITHVDHFSFPNGDQFGTYITKNDCSGVQHAYQWHDIMPRVGNCK
jgi:hypothetical protein